MLSLNLTVYPSTCYLLSAASGLVNINIHKLDAAFDIDPLFHKMSKTFDEGGAKGLLLANLGVSTHGCNIVFDSTLDDGEIKVSKDNDTSVSRPTAVDVSTLTAKIEASLNGQSMQQLPLVPQLAMLRSEYAILKDEGFVEKYKPVRRLTCYFLISSINLYLFLMTCSCCS